MSREAMMDLSVQGLGGEREVRLTWLDRTRVVAWSLPQLLIFCTGFFFVLLLSFSSGAWFGQWISVSLNENPGALAFKAVDQNIPGNDLALEPPASAEDSFEADEPQFTHTLSYTIKRSDNLHDALQSLGVPSGTIREWTRISRPYYNLSRVRPGQSFDLCVDEKDHPFLFVFHISPSRHLVIEARQELSAGYQARLDKQSPEPAQTQTARSNLVPVRFRYLNDQIQIQDPQTGGWTAAQTTSIQKASSLRSGKRFYQGRVKDSFYKAAESAGLSPGQIMELIEIFACEVDFRRELRSGDQFKVLLGASGENPNSGQKEEVVLAAMIETGKKPNWAFYYNEKGKKPAYYDQDGRSLKGFNLICPVKYKRISSGYSYRRLHPILKIYRPHLGVDYAAPTGTPIRAAASGVVTYAGWKGGYGRYIKIRHNSKYSTSYGHLSRYARGVRKGSRVRQGQVIGYVGSSGLATGPHLDYQIFRYGKPINPLRFYGEKGAKVANLSAFQNSKARLTHELERAESASERGLIYTSQAAGY
jgi:murein DD-endopeptidase MepM/ murein hydrolase activator NlpD